jgi:hypothetical protein
LIALALPLGSMVTDGDIFPQIMRYRFGAS